MYQLLSQLLGQNILQPKHPFGIAFRDRERGCVEVRFARDIYKRLRASGITGCGHAAVGGHEPDMQSKRELVKKI